MRNIADIGREKRAQRRRRITMNRTIPASVQRKDEMAVAENGDDVCRPITKEDALTSSDSVDDHLPRWVHTLRKRITELENDGRLDELLRDVH